MNRFINEAGIVLIKSFEGCSLVSYQDQAGVWTVGYGHTGFEVYDGLEISSERSEDLLTTDLYHLCKFLDPIIREDANENEFSALISLAYNVGPYAVKNSKLMGLVNAKEDPSKEWLTWDHVNHLENEGLKRRRIAELDLYKKPLSKVS